MAGSSWSQKSKQIILRFVKSLVSSMTIDPWHKEIKPMNCVFLPFFCISQSKKEKGADYNTFHVLCIWVENFVCTLRMGIWGSLFVLSILSVHWESVFENLYLCWESCLNFENLYLCWGFCLYFENLYWRIFICVQWESCLYFAPMGTDMLACSFHTLGRRNGENNQLGNPGKRIENV